jgi:hypothetical protein
MRVNRFPFLVLVLLASAWIDDAWAAAPAEGSLAALDNEYLCVSSPAQAESVRAAHQPPPGGAFLPAGSPVGTGPAPNPVRPARIAALFSPRLLYVLMSLQR